MDCDCAATAAAGVAFVAVVLRNPTAVARRVRVENRLAGPLLPPRTEGVPDAGWDATGVSVVLHPEESRSLGYACPLGTATADAFDTPADDASSPDLAEPPAEVVANERVAESNGTPCRSDTDARSITGDSDRTVRTVVRDLGRPAPPRDAVPAPDAPADRESTADRETTDASDTLDNHETTTDHHAPHDHETTTDHHAPHDHETTTDHHHEPPADTLPPPVAAWLAGIERRIETAERLAPDTSVAAATRAVETSDVPPPELSARLAEDRRRLRALADRLDRLAARAESASVPTDHLRRLS
jgi:hypothetical protein